uniref:Protein phosphatase 4 regulatory subunit 4 n=1 Tax=Callorhinchus milii TaxID=7868 RepID=A0A4W3GX70_CALMI
MDFSQEGLFGQIEDLQELSFIERPVRRYLKTPEEIERLTVDEELNDIERAVYLLSSGQDVQRTSVVVNLPNLVRQNPSDTLRRVVPKIGEVLHVAGVEMQLAAAVSFLTILQEELVSTAAYTHSFLPIILVSLDHRDAVVSNAWLETLLTVINTLPKETIRQEILSPLVSKAQLSQTIQSRLASCKILGKVARKFESHIIKRDILPLVKSLCQDVEYEVRSCMCRQLEYIAQGIGVEQTKSAILPELVELARDEGCSVRIAAFDTIVNLLGLFDSGNLTDDQQLWFLDFYKKFSTLGLQHENGHSEPQNQLYGADADTKYVAVRKNCAYNMPAMVLFVDPKHFYSDLYLTLSTLCHDPEALVRRAVAAGFHEVTKLLGSNAYLIHKELIMLLQDESLEVLDALIDHLPEILKVVTAGDHMHVPDLIPALMMAEQRAAISLKWRIHEKLLLTFACLPEVLSSDHIYHKFLPVMFRIITTNNVLPVQRASARTLCVFVRHNRKLEQRQEICCKLVEQLGQGKSYWTRLRFLDTCEYILDMFSKAFFCKYFFLPVVELSNDPVANVRIKLCYMLPKLKSALKLPTDKLLLQQLELSVRKLLCQEKDKDVTAIVRIVSYIISVQSIILLGLQYIKSITAIERTVFILSIFEEYWSAGLWGKGWGVGLTIHCSFQRVGTDSMGRVASFCAVRFYDSMICFILVGYFK